MFTEVVLVAKAVSESTPHLLNGTYTVWLKLPITLHVTAKGSSEVGGNELEAYKANNITFNSPIFCRPILGASSQNGCLPLIDIISLECVPVHVTRQALKLKKAEQS